MIPPRRQQLSTSQQQFNDEKEHYKSLRTLFITAMSIFSAFVTGILGVFLWSTFQSRKEMKEELEGTQKEMQLSMKEMKDDVKEKGEEFKRKESQWSSEFNDLKTSSKLEIQDLKTDAATEISSIRGLAIGEAKSRIDEVFKQTNLKDFIETVAKNEMSVYVIEKVKEEAVKVENQKAERYVLDLQSDDKVKMSIALNQLILNPDIPLSEDQISKIITSVRSYKDKDGYKYSFFAILYLRKSQQIAEFFKDELLRDPEHSTFRSGALLNIMRQDVKQDISFYEEYFERDKTHSNFSTMVTTANSINKDLAIQLLNSKPIVDFLWSSPENGGFKYLKENLVKNFGSVLNNQYKNTYFFTKH